jgi:epoxyqueuosine reductase QueG
MDMNDALREAIAPYYVDYLGFADLSGYQAELAASGGPMATGYECGISIGIALQNSIVDRLPDRSDPNVACEYRIHAYEVINQRLNIAASVAASFLAREGFRALPIPAADRADRENAAASVSHKMVAHIAGLGWIGKNCLLVTPERGPRVRWASVLTDAPFEKADDPLGQKCGACDACARICPSRSIRGVNYAPGEAREARFDYRGCEDYFEGLKETQAYPVCGMCLYVCPYGMKS